MLDGKPLIQLPAKNIELIELDFSEEERAVYSMVEQKVRQRDSRSPLTLQAQDVFNRYRKAGTVMKVRSSALGHVG